MKKILIVLFFTIIIIIFFIVIMQKNSFKKGSDTKIAYWNFNSNILGKKQFSLAETADKGTLNNGYIAPGSKGEFEIILDGKNSEVDILYTIKIEKEQNTPYNLVFSTYVNKNKKEFQTLKEMFEKIDFSGIIKRNEKKIVKHKILWEWPYETYLENGEVDEEKDKKDFEDGISGLNYTFIINIEAVQSK